MNDESERKGSSQKSESITGVLIIPIYVQSVRLSVSDNDDYVVCFNLIASKTAR
jgi:hypothetical protein